MPLTSRLLVAILLVLALCQARRRRPRYAHIDKVIRRASCHYNLTWNRNSHRIPRNIPSVVCHGRGNCQVDKKKEGCCTTVELTIDVAYNTSGTWKIGKETFPVACLCLRGAPQRMSSKEPDLVD